MSAQGRVLIVCTGNVCRSPFIERLLQSQLAKQRPGSTAGDPGILVHSAGTGALAGSAMDDRAAAQLVANGGDPMGFIARDLTPALIAESDLVLTATRAHRGRVATMHPKAMRRMFTFRDFADLVSGMDGLGADVPQTDSGVWVRQVTERAAACRGLTPPLEPARADIVDPFRREDKVFAIMAQQIVDSMPAVVRALVG